MILTLMLVILTATLVIVIIGFVMDRLAVTKIKSGMRTLNKRIKRLEKTEEPIEGGYLYVREAINDSDTDKETQTEDGSALPDNPDGDI